jgi:hypothetical protein
MDADGRLSSIISAYAHIGGRLWNLKCLHEALASYQRALAVRPDYGDALYNRGSSRFPQRCDLMRSLDGRVQVIGREAGLPTFDLHCPLLSLPLAFGTRLETIPSKTPYLSVSQEDARNWNLRLGSKHRPRIGLAWSGRPTRSNDRNRSTSFECLLRLLEIDATFVSLQKDVRPDDAPAMSERSDLLQFADELLTFADTAALISNLDLVISVDTSVAHLAGALAKPVWVLLPFFPEWRWLLDRDDSLWYPTARLFRQNAAGDWWEVMAGLSLRWKSCWQLMSAHPCNRAFKGVIPTPAD